ncbi:MAG: flagellar motor stator protein MotA, partial [Gammaproteobacteria bacterium]|nr:flagellar motor stator protein MotA [Gammaproteobacteria bacterium]
MMKIIGIIMVFGCVLAGFVLSGGKIASIIQPFEVLIIGGAAMGAFLQANPGSTFMQVLKKSLAMFGSRF